MDLWREEKLPPQRKETVEPLAMTSMGAQVIFAVCFYLFIYFYNTFFSMVSCHDLLFSSIVSVMCLLIGN